MTIGATRALALLLLAAATAVGTTELTSPPTMVKQPPHEMAYTVSRSPRERDTPFVLECEAEGNPEPIYKWRKDGQEFHHFHLADRLTQQPHRGSLVFTKPDHKDEGLYQCQATNLYGTSVSNAVWVRKAEVGKFTSGPPKVGRAMEGTPLSLRCAPPVGGYPPPKLLWGILQEDGGLRKVNSARLTIDPEGRLHFPRVELDDQLSDAVYACVASSEFWHEYPIVDKVQLEVESRPSGGNAELAPVQQYVSPPTLKVLRGQTLRLYCIYGGTPLPQITWTKQGAGSPTQTERLAYDNINKTLVIKSVTFEDDGTYECHASNGVGVEKTHVMNVKVEAEPHWQRAPNNTVAAEGGSVRFECAAAGVPEPDLQWFVNGVPIDSAQPNQRRKVEGSVLSIEPLARSDTAVFQCNASNPHGYAFWDFYLNVAGA